GPPATASPTGGPHHMDHQCRGQAAAAHLQRRQCPAALDPPCHCTLLPGLSAVLRDPRELSLGAQRQTGTAALFGGLCVHTTRQHLTSPDRSDYAGGAAYASVPLYQRPLPGASGAGIRQARGGDGRFAPALGDCSLDAVRGYHATLTWNLLESSMKKALTWV